MSIRPCQTDTEEDILRMQDEFMRRKDATSDGGNTPAATVVRIGKKTTPSASCDSTVLSSTVPSKMEADKSQKTHDGARFCLNLDAEGPPSTEMIIEPNEQVLCGVEERNASFIEGDDVDNVEALISLSSEAMIEYSKEDGFPDVLDLSSYYNTTNDTESTTVAPPGCSYFAALFDRLHGRLTESVDMDQLEEKKTIRGDNEDDDEIEEYEVENEERLKRMSNDELERARMEIEERLDPALLSWLKDRHKRRAAPSPADSEADPEMAKPSKKMSRFKQERMAKTASSDGGVTVSSNTQVPPTSGDITEEASVPPLDPTILRPVEELIGNLEILDEYTSREDQEKYDRLAIDAVRMELASRSMRFVLPRQQANAIRLFDMLKHGKKDGVQDALVEHGRSRIEDIKSLYLEIVEHEDGRVQPRFASGCSPLTDVGWMLAPIRRVLDDVQSSESNTITSTHIDSVRLALLWSLLLAVERPSAWAAYSEPGEIYVRTAECFLMGPSIFNDDVISSCLERLYEHHLLPSAIEGRLTIRMASRIAGLDVFAPFYDDLLRAFEQHALGSPLFSSFLLLPAYLNGSIADGLQLSLALWTPQRAVVRQITLSPTQCTTVERAVESTTEMENALFVPYAQLLGCYLAAIRDDRVVRGRNDVLFTLASDELGRFVRRHTVGGTAGLEDPARAREFDALVDIVRRSMNGKISF